MGSIPAKDGIRLHYDEYGTGDRIILSAQVGFYPAGMQQALAERGYHVYCMTLRGFAPSDHIDTDYGDRWYDVFAEDEAVAEALRGDAAQRVVVVLVTRHHEADGVAGIGLQLFTEIRVADVVVQAELRIRHVGAGDVLQVDGALRGIHAVVVEMDTEFEIGDGEGCQAEMSFA